MPKLTALFGALPSGVDGLRGRDSASRAARRPRQSDLVGGSSTPPAAPRKPRVLADHVVERLAAADARAAESAAALAVVLRAWITAVLDGTGPSPLSATDVALAVAGGELCPAAHHETGAVRRLRLAVEEIERRFSSPWDAPHRARTLARLFTACCALMTMGVVAAASVAAPPPTVPLHHLATIVDRSFESRATANTVAASAATVPAAAAAEPTTTAPPAPTPAPAPAPAPPPPPAPSPPAQRGALPVGKGMWIWLPERVEGGDPNAIVAKAKAVGLTHVFVRTGSSKDGFTGGPFLDALLPVAHANGLRVYGWDFAECDNPGDDVNRALTAIRYTTPDGQRIDGFSPDIETPSEGTTGNVEYLAAYAQWLRDNVGDAYPLIATLPNPTAYQVARGYPYAQILGPFDAVAPMVYWMNREPGADVANAISYLSQFGKPIFPIGQAYDGGPEGGPPGVPSRDQLLRFMQVADQAGATGASFWSWQHADDQAWQAIADADDFRLGVGGPDGGLTPGMTRGYQMLLTSLGFAVAADGVYGPATIAAVSAYQQAAHLPVTGLVDEPTRAMLLTPVAPPVRDPNA